jgi:hypothetical protein
VENVFLINSIYSMHAVCPIKSQFLDEIADKILDKKEIYRIRDL